MCMDDYVRIIEEMLAKGEKVTLQEVRRVAGKGSYSTISDAIKLVLNRGLTPAEVAGPAPESLAEAANGLWREACKLAGSIVASERLALHSARMELLESQRELTALADSLSRQVDELTVRVESLRAEKETAEKRAQAAEANLKATRQLLKELGLKPAKAEADRPRETEER